MLERDWKFCFALCPPLALGIASIWLFLPHIP